MKRRRGAGVAAGDCVGVLVECGRHALVIEPTGNDHDRDAGVEHLRGHEVSIVPDGTIAQAAVEMERSVSARSPVRRHRRRR